LERRGIGRLCCIHWKKRKASAFRRGVGIREEGGKNPGRMSFPKGLWVEEETGTGCHREAGLPKRGKGEKSQFGESYFSKKKKGAELPRSRDHLMKRRKQGPAREKQELNPCFKVHGRRKKEGTRGAQDRRQKKKKSPSLGRTLILPRDSSFQRKNGGFRGGSG